MKKTLLLFAFILAIVVSANAQNIYPVDKESQADVKLFVVNNERIADICVYDVNSVNQNERDNGKWHFVCCENDAQKKVYFVENEKQADIKVYFVNTENQAGWKNNSKNYLMK